MKPTDFNWEKIHRFWFSDLSLSQSYLKDHGKLWFSKDDAQDKKIEDLFSPYLQHIDKNHHFLDWKNNPKSFISYIVLLDQFSRNIFRNTPKSFSYDTHALSLCLEGLEKGIDLKLSLIERVFFYLPLEHSEDLDMQILSMEKYQNLLEEAQDSPFAKTFENFLLYAQKHYDIIEQFNRFPHRNNILNRPSTKEELIFLQQDGSSF